MHGFPRRRACGPSRTRNARRRSDNGLIYQNRRFRAACRDHRLRQEFITPYTPEQNSLIERYFRSLKEECVGRHLFPSFAVARRAIATWIRWYTEARPYEALGYRSSREHRAQQSQLVACFRGSGTVWHAAGLGEHEVVRPEWTEHFGIVTVEAMAAGCVPIEIRKGDQPEIVEHGVSGFLRDTLEELKEYTELLAGDEALRARMATAAQARAPHFSRAAYVNAMVALLEPLLA